MAAMNSPSLHSSLTTPRADAARDALLQGDVERAIVLWQQAQANGRQDDVRAAILGAVSERLHAAVSDGDFTAAQRWAQAAAGLGTQHPDVARLADVVQAWSTASALADAREFDSASAALGRLAELCPRAKWIAKAKRRLDDAAKLSAEIDASPLGARQRDAARSASGAPAATGPAAAFAPRFCLWVDGAGSYLVLTRPSIAVGRGDRADLALDAPISRTHAELQRIESDWFLVAHKPTTVNGRAVERVMLSPGDAVNFGGKLACEFRVRSKLSATAALAFDKPCLPSRDMRQVILMADNIIFSNDAAGHVQSDLAEGRVVLFWGERGLECQTDGDIEVNGQPQSAPCPIALGDRVEAAGWSFALTGDAT